MQALLGIIIILALIWPAIKLVLAMPYGIAIVAGAVLLWAAALK